MADDAQPQYRRLVLHSFTQPGMMMVFWTPKAPEHSTVAALNRLECLRGDGSGLPSPHRAVIAAKDKVHALPLQACPPTPDSPYSAEEFEQMQADIINTTDMLLYGEYGTFGQILRWNIHGAALRPLPCDWFVPQPDINNLDGSYICQDWMSIYLRRVKKDRTI
jgi:hypothetical protein